MPWRISRKRISAAVAVIYGSLLLLPLLYAAPVFAGDLNLDGLVEEALKHNHDIIMGEAKWKTSRFKIPQAGSLPDPMVMIGYQNEGFEKYTYGEMPDAQWMFSASQMFPFAGKRGLKREMAARDSDAAFEGLAAVRQKTAARVTELFFDLLFAYKEQDLLEDRALLFARIEDAATARYAAGKGMQQEVIMAQSERYMIRERLEMVKQRLASLEAMINAAVGKDMNAPLGRPADPPERVFDSTLDILQLKAYAASPELKAREAMIGAADARVRMARREFYPDFTISATYMKRGASFEDMWSLATTFSIPLYYKEKQQQAVYEAESMVDEAVHDLEGMKFMISSALWDNYSMITSSENLMELYKSGLIPKAYQDFEASLSGYTAGMTDAITVVSRLKSLIDYEIMYWKQYAEKGKAIGRIDAITGRWVPEKPEQSAGVDKP